MTYPHRLTAALLAWAALASPVLADVKAEVGSTTMAAGNEINLVGAFQPKALVVWGSLNSANPTANAYGSVGFADGTSQASVAIFSGDALADSDTARAYRTNGLYEILSTGTPTSYSTAALSSFDSDGFTLSKGGTGGSADANSKLSYLALGGTDLTNAKIVTVLTPNATGSQAKTGVGFRPDCVIFLYDQPTTPGTGEAGALLSFGFATAGAQYSVGIDSVDALATTDTYRRVSNTGVIYAAYQGTVYGVASLSSFDADGFTLNWTTANAGTANKPIAALCLKFTSPSYVKAGHVTTGTANGQTITASGLGHTPKGVMMMGTNATFGSVATTLFASVGAFDDTRMAYAAVEDVDNSATSVAKSRFGTNRPFVVMSGGSEYEYLASPALSSGQFTLTATKSDTTARLVPYLSIGQPAGGGQGAGPELQAADFLLLLSDLDRLKGSDRLYAAAAPSYALAP